MTGREWLPDDVYLVRSDDGRQSPLVDVAKDGRPVDGLVPIATGLRSARNTSLPLRALQDTQVGKVVMLAWDAGEGSTTWGVGDLAPHPASHPPPGPPSCAWHSPMRPHRQRGMIRVLRRWTLSSRSRRLMALR